MSSEFPKKEERSNFEQYPEGLQRDIHVLRDKILSADTDFLVNGAPMDLRMFVDDSFGLIDQSKKPMLLSELVNILLIVVGEGEWNYDDIDFRVVRAEIEKQGFSLKPRKTGGGREIEFKL
jgi:hypothetical protein